MSKVLVAESIFNIRHLYRSLMGYTITSIPYSRVVNHWVLLNSSTTVVYFSSLLKEDRIGAIMNEYYIYGKPLCSVQEEESPIILLEIYE